MSNFVVLSFNPTTRCPELMQFETLLDAESHNLRAQDEGRILVEIVASPDQHEWALKAREIAEACKDRHHSCLLL
jgi:hypothetical protein